MGTLLPIVTDRHVCKRVIPKSSKSVMIGSTVRGRRRSLGREQESSTGIGSSADARGK